MLVNRHLPKSAKAMVSEWNLALKPALEEHFYIPLKDIEKPAFLMYGEGSFYKPHRDTHREDPPQLV